MTRFSMTEGTQTRKSSSGQPFDEDYQLWLAGFWEDFTGTYCMPEAKDNALSMTDTHFGNPMNAEARLNPHYRWSYADRVLPTYSGGGVSGSPLSIKYGKVTNDIKALHNQSMSEWTTIDFTRLGKGRDYISKLNNEYPDSLAHSNRHRFGGRGELENYMTLTTSHTTTGKYYVSNGESDATFGRLGTTTYGFESLAGQPTISSNGIACTSISSVQPIVKHTANAVTCGVFTTDTAPSDILTISNWNQNQHGAQVLGAEIKSPSRTPFLAIRHTMPPTRRFEGKVDGGGTDGVWEYTGGSRELHHLRVGDIVQVGKDDEFCVIQDINSDYTKITKLYSLSRNELLNVSKYKSGQSDHLGGGASENNVDIRKWFEPVFTYDGDLNCVADGDTFHFRFCPLSINKHGLPETDRIGHYILRVGFDSSRLEMTSNGNRYRLSGSDYNPSHTCAAIEVELQLNPDTESQKIQKDINQVRISTLDASIRTDHKQAFIDYDASSTVTTPNYDNEWEHWVDVDIVMDFTNQRYKVYIDGYEASTFNFETKPSGSTWKATDLYGFHLDHALLQKDGTYTAETSSNEHAMSAGKYWGSEASVRGCLYTLIDRFGIVNEITMPVRNSPNTIVSGSDLSILKMAIRNELNMTSSADIDIADDDNERQIQDIFASTPSEWMTIFFKNGIDNPLWLGYIDKIRVQQVGQEKSRMISIKSRDSLGRTDGIMPYWEVGQGEKTGPSTAYAYRKQEAEAVADNFYFGARRLLKGAQTLGMDHQTRAAHPQAITTEIGAVQGYYSARYDQRTRLYSANPIQMYVGEDLYGPSCEPDKFNTAPTAQDSDKNIWRMWNTKKIIGFSDGRHHHWSYIIAHCIEHDLEVDDEFVIYGADIPNAFTVQSGGEVDGMTIVVKKIIDDNHFCFQYKNSPTHFGQDGNEPAHFWSVVTRDADNLGLGMSLTTGGPYSHANSSSTWEVDDQYFASTKNVGLTAIRKPNGVIAVGKFNPLDHRHWNPHYTFRTLTIKTGGVTTNTINPTWFTHSAAGTSANDSVMMSALSKDISTPFYAASTIASASVPTIQTSTSNYMGWYEDGFVWKPAGILPLESTAISPVLDEHGLVTVGPRASFMKSTTSPLNTNSKLALTYINYGTGQERSQIMTLIDVYKRFHLDTVLNRNWQGTVYQDSTAIDYNTKLTSLIRGNDIDQQDPGITYGNVAYTDAIGPSLPFNPDAADHHPDRYVSGLRTLLDAAELRADTESASSTIGTITLDDGYIDRFPYSGYAIIATEYDLANGNSGSQINRGWGNDRAIIKYTSINESNKQLLGVTYVASVSNPPDSTGGQVVQPLVFPVMVNCQAVFTPPVARQPRQQYRIAHASYMHDIASSPWFRMVFGIIESYAAGTHGPPYWGTAYTGNKAFWSRLQNIDGNWTYPTMHDANGVAQAVEYGDSSQYSDYFTLKADFNASTDSTFTIENGTPPLVDENFKDRRWIDKGSRTHDAGTDPLISIPSRAWSTDTDINAMKNGMLVFEIENDDGTLDVGVANSCKMTTCKDTTGNYTHWEIVRIKQSEIANHINNTNTYAFPNTSPDKYMPGPIWLWAAKNPADYVSTAETMYDTNDKKDPDYFHSGNPRAVSGSRLFTSLEVGDIVFVGNTQGAVSQPPTSIADDWYNVDNPYGEERDFVSYRWYRVIDKWPGNEAIAIFPAEYAFCDHTLTSNKHPVAMGLTKENAVSGSFVGWSHKLVRATGTTNPYNSEQPSGFPNTNKAICKVYSGDILVEGVKHLTKNHKAGAKGRFRVIRNDFKHIWLNWADMRNDGSADADGGTKDSSFGLLYPTEEYDVSLIFSKSQEAITELKVGDDVDLWELSGTDPYSQTIWSANYTNKQNLEHLKNWESKAGAPMLVDASKFFNLNTMANNGRIGQFSGGEKTIGEYSFTSAGVPVLMDSYWWEAGPHPYTAKYRHPYDPNYQFYVRYETKLAANNYSGKPIAILDSSNVYQGSYFTDWTSAGVIESKDENDTAETFTYKMGGCFVTDYDETASSTASRLYLDFGAERVGEVSTTETIPEAMSRTEYYENDLGTFEKKKEHTVYNSWAAMMGLGAMLAIEGHIKAPGANTYYTHDQIRLIFQNHRAQTWLSGTDLPMSYDINNVPIAYQMDCSQQGGSAPGPHDSFGNVLDLRGKTTFQMFVGLHKSSGQGDAGNYQPFHYLIGKDNRFEFRPSYLSGQTIDRSILQVSDVQTEARTQFTHIRAIYNNGGSFVDVPEPILDGSSTKWKILPLLAVNSSTEAKAIANRELKNVVDTALTVDAKVISTNQDNVAFQGLHGYICTPLVQNFRWNSTYMGMTPLSNLDGQLIGGRINAMDGNLDATNTNYIGEQRSMEYLESGVGYHGGGGCDSYQAHTLNTETGTTTNWRGQFTPYGVCSIEKAVQVVYVPKGTPKVSAGSGEKLRIFITHNSNVANEGKFRIWLVDSHFDSQRRQGYTGNNPLTSSKISHVDVQTNGYVQIPFPSTYGAPSGAKMILSFNREYCLDLLKYRSNNTTSAKSNRGNRTTTLPSTDVSTLDLTANSIVNESSAFPLGLPLFYRPFGSEDSQGRQGPLWHIRPRSLYYAPQIEIVDDFTWRPGRNVTYTDAKLNLNESLTVVRSEWQQTGQQTEELLLTLKRDESQLSKFGFGGSSPVKEPGGDGGSSGGGISDRPPFHWGDDNAPGWGGLKPPDRGGIGSGWSLIDNKSNDIARLTIDGSPDQFGGDGGGARMTSLLSMNKLSKGTGNAFKGMGDLLSEGAEGDSGLLGINRNRSSMTHTSKTTAREAIGQTKSTSSGSAIMSASGFSLPGVSKLPEGGSITQADYHEGSVIITVPPAVSSKSISVVGTIKAPSTGAGTKYTLFTTLECLETGFKQNKRVDITPNDDSQRVVLFSRRQVDGADISGNQIKVTVGRVPGGGSITNADGSDDSPFASLNVKGIEVVFNEKAQSKSSAVITTTKKMRTDDNTRGWMTHTSNAWLSKTPDADYNTSDVLGYTRRGRAGSNALRKSDGKGGYSEDSL